MATEVQSTDEQSEKLAEDFLRGNVPVENFLSGFLAIRKVRIGSLRGAGALACVFCLLSPRLSVRCSLLFALSLEEPPPSSEGRKTCLPTESSGWFTLTLPVFCSFVIAVSMTGKNKSINAC